MSKENKIKIIQTMPFKRKWYEFIIIFGLINIYSFWGINSVMNSIYKNFSKLFVSNLSVDGSNLSIFANMFAAPLFIALTVINIVIFLVEELFVILLFKFIYFKSMVKDEEKIRLYQYTKIALLYFLLANIIAIGFYCDIKRAVFFAFLYLIVPLFNFLFICLKIKKMHETGTITVIK